MTTVVLWVGDLVRSADYYRDLFGADSYYLTTEFASVKGSGNEVLLHLAPEQYRHEVSVGADNPIKPVFSVSSIESSRQVAAKHSCFFSGETLQHNGVTYLDGSDPDGHVIQIAVS